MTIADRERQIVELLTAHPAWSLSAIAREAGVAVTTVIRVKDRIERGLGRSQMDPTKKVTEQRAEARTADFRKRFPSATIEAYVKPALREYLTAYLPEHADTLEVAPRHSTQHHYRVSFDPRLRADASALLNVALPAWRAEYATGEGRDGRAVARRLIEQAEELLTALGLPIPLSAPPRMIRVTPTTLDALKARGVAAAHTAKLHKETHKWEISVPASDVAALDGALAALEKDATVERDASRAVVRSRLSRMLIDVAAARAALA